MEKLSVHLKKITLNYIIKVFLISLLQWIMYNLQRIKGNGCAHSQPATAVCKMEAQLEHMHIVYKFLHFWHRFVCSVGAY